MPPSTHKSRFDKWVHGWLFGQQGISGAGRDFIHSVDPRSPKGLLNAMAMFSARSGGFRQRAPEYSQIPVQLAEARAGFIRNITGGMHKPQEPFQAFQAATRGRMTHEGKDWTNQYGDPGQSLIQDSSIPRFARFQHTKNSPPRELSMEEIVANLFSPKSAVNDPAALYSQLLQQMGHNFRTIRG